MPHKGLLSKINDGGLLSFLLFDEMNEIIVEVSSTKEFQLGEVYHLHLNKDASWKVGELYGTDS